MAYYPQNATGLNYITYPVGPTASMLVVTSGALNTKGAYTQFIASSPFQCNEIIITSSSTDLSLYGLVDIATGGVGSEVDIIPNLLWANTEASTGFSGRRSYLIPCNIPAGSRISARWQANAASKIVVLSITLIAAGGVAGITPFTNEGITLASSRGTQVDPGGVANTKGAYSQLVASTTGIIQWMSLLAINTNTVTNFDQQLCVDIATGGAGSEVVLVPDIRIAGGHSNGQNPFVPSGANIRTYIPAGTRIAVRASCDVTDATARVFDCSLLWGTAPAEGSGGGGSFGFA